MASATSLCWCSSDLIRHGSCSKVFGRQKVLNLNQSIVRSRGRYNDYQKQRKFFVCAATEGSAKSSKSEETIPTWAKPDSDEPPPWAKGMSRSKLRERCSWNRTRWHRNYSKHEDDSKVTSEPTQRMSRSMILEPKLPPGMSPGRSPVMKVIQEDGKRSPEILLEDDGEEVLTNPYKAAVASGVSFLIGSCVPLLSAVLVAQNVVRILVIAVVASIALAFFGGFGSYLGGSPIRIPQ
ncbi:vacuolar iron transporter-like 2.1-like [Populus alba x Populus x berolinensis]|nr:vacuolar iron transporter-like 2.1-like [Populus alba x Populus x berolinensis]